MQELDKSKFVILEATDLSNYYKTYGNLNIFDKNILKPQTQKAKGVLFLESFGDKLRSLNLNVPHHLVFKAGAQFVKENFNFPVFARPCPLTPRHGFVDSILCKTVEELNKLSEETLKEDSNSEILITKIIQSDYNVIFNDGIITFGLGNDGATSGTNCHYFYIDNDSIGQTLNVKNSGLIVEGEAPFYEFVISNKYASSTGWGDAYLVQVRSAPYTPKCKDFVPQQVKVGTIIKAEGSLIEWEERMKNIDKASTIIDHTGGTLSSHYAIHAIVNNIPIFTTYLPELGSVVEATTISTEITVQDQENFFQGFVDGFNCHKYYKKCYSNAADWAKHIVITALATLHNFKSLASMKDYRLLGIILGLFSKVTFAVSAGESRFAEGRTNYEAFSEHFKLIGGTGQSRAPLYDLVLNADLELTTKIVGSSYTIFDQVKWGGAYGGPRWLSCTKSAINLFNACIKKDIKSVVTLFNNVINEMHNGGKYLNKVIRQEEFDYASQDPSKYAIKNLVHIVRLVSFVNAQEKSKDYDKFKIIPLEVDKSILKNYLEQKQKELEKAKFIAIAEAEKNKQKAYEESKKKIVNSMLEEIQSIGNSTTDNPYPGFSFHLVSSLDADIKAADITGINVTKDSTGNSFFVPIKTAMLKNQKMINMCGCDMCVKKDTKKLQPLKNYWGGNISINSNEIYPVISKIQLTKLLKESKAFETLSKD